MVKTKTQISFWVLGFVTAALLLVGVRATFGNVTSNTPNQELRLNTYTFFATSTLDTTYFATTTTATSTNITPWADNNGRIDNGYFIVQGAKDVTFYFTRQAGNGQGATGRTTFKVEVTPDGTNWYPYPSLRAASTTNAGINGFYTTVSSVSMQNVTNATTTDMYKMVDLGWYAVRCIVVETTDGEHACKATAQY